MNDVKRGLLCLLFGGTLAEVQETSRKRRRRGLAGGSGQGREGEGEGSGHGLNQSMMTDDDGEMGKLMTDIHLMMTSYPLTITTFPNTQPTLTHPLLTFSNHTYSPIPTLILLHPSLARIPHFTTRARRRARP